MSQGNVNFTRHPTIILHKLEGCVQALLTPTMLGTNLQISQLKLTEYNDSGATNHKALCNRSLIGTPHKIPLIQQSTMHILR